MRTVNRRKFAAVHVFIIDPEKSGIQSCTKFGSTFENLIFGKIIYSHSLERKLLDSEQMYIR